MKIKTTELPMTLDAIRQEVIKKEGERIIGNYEQNYFNIAFVILVLAVVIMLAAGPHHFNKPIFIIELCIIGIAISLISIVMVGTVRRYYNKRLSPKDYGLSDKEIENKMIEYIDDKLRAMVEEVYELSKEKQMIITKYNIISDAYSPVIDAYRTLYNTFFSTH